MLHTPLPLIGVRGIRWLARAVERLRRADDDAAALLYVGHIVRMQEEIGTGGAGFRFMYAAFLQELAAKTGYGALDPLAVRLVEIGDEWQQFAFSAAKMIKRRIAFEPPRLGARLRELASREQRFFQDLTQAATTTESRYGFGASDGTNEASSAFTDQYNTTTVNTDAICARITQP